MPVVKRQNETGRKCLSHTLLGGLLSILGTQQSYANRAGFHLRKVLMRKT